MARSTDSVDDPRTWLKPMIKIWREQFLRAMRGYKELPGDARHYDGWPASSPMAKIMFNVPGRSYFFPKLDQYWAEVFTGDGLTIRRAMEQMPFQSRVVLYANQISGLSRNRQLRILFIEKHVYYRLLDGAYAHLAARVDTIAPRNSRHGKQMAK